MMYDDVVSRISEKISDEPSEVYRRLSQINRGSGLTMIFF